MRLAGLASEKERVTPLITNLRVELGVLAEKKQLLENERGALSTEKERTSLKIKEQDKPSEQVKSQWQGQEQAVMVKIATIDEKLKVSLAQIQNFNLEEQAKKDKLFKLERQYQENQGEVNFIQQQLNDKRITQARLETRQEELEKSAMHELGGLDWLGEAKVLPLAEFDPLFVGIERYKAQLEMIGGIDPETVKEYKEASERYEFLDSQIKDLSGAMDSLEKIVVELDGDIKDQFNSAFNQIGQEFAKFFKILFNGGQAKLTKIEALPESADDSMAAGMTAENGQVMSATAMASEAAAVAEKSEQQRESRVRKFWGGTYNGIEIYACPPGKKLASINMLSGGERALSSLALIAAIISVNPAPFVVFDEVDAALDEANSHRMAHIIKQLADKTQFLMITHNRSIMHAADTIYGVTMGIDGVSKMISVKMEEALAKATRL